MAIAGTRLSRRVTATTMTVFVAATLVAVAIAGVGGTAAAERKRSELFTLGFRGSDAEFVIRVRTREAIAELRADLERPRRERRIVSGIVRRGRPYNPAWSYSMGSRSIILGEVFIEVCDASPEYVEETRAEWLGERWCPWSSFVKRAGAPRPRS